MLLSQMLREMRQSRNWPDEDEDNQGSGMDFGADRSRLTIEIGPVKQLGKAGGFGLATRCKLRSTGTRPRAGVRRGGGRGRHAVAGLVSAGE